MGKLGVPGADTLIFIRMEVVGSRQNGYAAVVVREGPLGEVAMPAVLFLTYPGSESRSGALLDQLQATVLTRLQNHPNLQTIDAFTPAQGPLPALHTPGRSPLLVQLSLTSPAAALGLLQSGDLDNVLQARDGAAPLVDVYERMSFPVPGHEQPPPRKATLSFLVRYYRPVADERAFVDFYTSHHPLLQAQFPAIRNIYCYLPTDTALPAKLSSSGSFFTNEVVFDDLVALQAALDSDVLPKMLAEGKQFPPYDHNTRHAMIRQRLYER